MSASEKLTSSSGSTERAETFTVKEKLEINKKSDKTSSPDDQKPRIVLTFRTEKPGLKSSSMKIVSSEEKFDKTPESCDDVADSSGKRKTTSQTASESDESAEMSTPKRSTRWRTKEYSDNVLANAIARKKKSYNEAIALPRPSRRMKPISKASANKELKVELEGTCSVKQKIATIDDRLLEEGVQTRRSTRRKSIDETISVDTSPKKRKMDDNSQEEVLDSESKKLIKLKKRHLSKLGLKAKDDQGKEDESTMDSMNNESLGDTVSLGKLADSEWEDSKKTEVLSDEEPEDDEEVCYSSSEEECVVIRGKKETTSKSPRKPRKNRDGKGSAQSAIVEEKAEEARPERPRRACTRFKQSWYDFYINNGEELPEEEPPEGDEAEDAARPEDDKEKAIIALCTCEDTSNLYPVQEDDANTDGLFCRAIETVDGLRVGCSHRVSAESPLIRAGPRSPWISACSLHTAMMRKHMCCNNCGLFCTRGVFYQCSKSHLFHLECGFTTPEKGPPGCPHCGHTITWALGNTDCSMVKVSMTSKSLPIYTTEQRDISIPAYLCFSSIKPAKSKEPIIPPDILPAQPIDLKKLLSTHGNTAAMTEEAVDSLIEAVVNHDPAEQLICKMAGMNVNKSLEEANGGTLAHLAAKWGNLTALYLLQYAGASLDATDSTMKTPLMVAVLALLDKPLKKPKVENVVADTHDVGAKSDKDSKSAEDDVTSGSGKGESETNEKLMNVIRYLVSAGCNVNLPGPEGLTALHMSAQHGGASVCEDILSAADVDVDARDHGGWSPLVWAAENKHPSVVRLLLSHGANPSSRDSEGNSVVHWCALSGDSVSLQLLLRRGHADIANGHADTPLHVAARQGHYACVVILLAHGARTDIENSSGQLPVEVCSGVCQAAISLNMQMQLAISDNKAPYRLLSSDISKGRERDPIPCVNEVDNATLPEFQYVTELVYKSQINIDNSLAATQGCSCGDSCEEGDCGCYALCVRRWTRNGRLLPSFPFSEPAMIFECNQLCHCDLKKCPNTVITRATQSGSTFVRCEVYRFGGARGWGLRAATAVPRGAPVATYCGELLTMQDADTRVNDHYMFALQVKADLLEQCVEKKQLCLDAMSYGSAARFINHSCSPNLAPVRVFTKIRDLRLPLVTLFATRDIAHHEELTFDYGEKFWSVKQKHMKCECGTTECRYPTIDRGDEN